MTFVWASFREIKRFSKEACLYTFSLALFEQPPCILDRTMRTVGAFTHIKSPGFPFQKKDKRAETHIWGGDGR